jgi:head-tail adaptor
MFAGRLDRRIKIQRRSRSLTASGQPTEIWLDIVARWASVGPVTGAERFSVPQLVAKEVVEVQIRYSPVTADLHPGDRVVFPSGADPDAIPTAVYDILAVHEIGRREGQRIIAERSPIPAVDYFDPDASAIVAAFTTSPTEARANLINTTVKALKTAGVWAPLRAFYVRAAHAAQAGLVNWKSPGTFDSVVVPTMVFTVDRGFSGDGITGNLVTGFDPSTQLAQNSAAFGAWVLTDEPETQHIMGTGDNDNKIATNAGTGLFYALNGSGDIMITASEQGHLAISRTAATVCKAYRNGAVVGMSAAPSTPHLVGGNLRFGLISSFATVQFATGFAADGLSDTQMASLFGIEQAWLQAVGAVP